MDGVVDNESDIILDIVICADKGENTGGKVSSNAALNFITGVKENRFYHNIQSIQIALQEYPEVQQRLYFQEHDEGCNIKSVIDFDNSTTWCLQEAGRRDAKNYLDGVGGEGQKTLQQWYDDNVSKDDDENCEGC